MKKDFRSINQHFAKKKIGLRKKTFLAINETRTARTQHHHGSCSDTMLEFERIDAEYKRWMIE
jgi:hypothetical protein